MKTRFEEIYSRDEWLYGSGEGSLPKHTKPYVSMLQIFLSEYRIRTVVDMGCGDWQFSKLVNWKGIAYQGFDIVQSVIAKNRDDFSSSNVGFHLYSGNSDELPQADLLIAKDVLQHWSNKSIEAFLPNTARYKYCLITNCINPNGKTTNTDIEDGGFRYLDLLSALLGVAAKELLTFTNHSPPLVSLFSNRVGGKRCCLFNARLR